MTLNLKQYKLIIPIIFILGFLYRTIFIYRNMVFLTDFWLFEDTFYSLGIAKNIAYGLGWTFDGVILTNGFQPLYVFLMVPVYWVFKNDLITPVYVALTLLAIFNVVTGYILYKICDKLTNNDILSLIVACIWLFNPSIARNGTNGLETGLSTFLFALAIYVYLFYIRDMQINYKNYFIFGLILGFAYLGRIDNLILFAFIGFDYILFHTRKRDILNTKNMYPYILTIIGFLLLFLPYTIYNIVNFSYPFPLSGKVLKGVPPNLNDFIYDFITIIYNCVNVLIGKMTNSGGVAWPVDNILSNQPLENQIIFLVFIIFMLLIVSISIYKINADNSIIFSSLNLFVVTYISIYIYLYSNIIFERYYYPIIFTILILIAILIDIVHTFDKNNKCNTILLIIIFLIVLIGLIYCNITAIDKINKGNYYHPGWFNGINWMNYNFGNNITVAAMQCGNTGYFYKSRAINLDGVVNYDVILYKENHELLKYFSINNITCLADEGGWVFNALSAFNNIDEENIIKSKMQLVYKNDDCGAYNIYLINNYSTYNKIIDLDSSDIDKYGAWKLYNSNEYINDDIYMSYAKGDYISFVTNHSVTIRTLKHPWSGILDIYLNNNFYKSIDLYSQTSNPTYNIYIPIKENTQVKLVVSGKKNELSKGYEIWIDAIFK